MWKRIGLLLLLARVGVGTCVADSPRWADEQMLLPWPAALSGAAESAGNMATIPPTDGSSVAGEGLGLPGGPVAPALWADSHTANGDAIRPIESVEAQRIVSSVRPAALPCSSCEGWHFLPAGVLYRSYIAGEKEPRMAAAVLSERHLGTTLESTLGGRLGFLRYGTAGPINPQGWQWDLEGAAMLRQNFKHNLDVEATDFRIGSVVTRRRGPTAVKAGYYHLSSHVGDEFLARNPTFPRLNYVRDAFLIGVYHNLNPDLAVYGEIAYAFNTDGGAEPIELQFGVEYAPYDPTRSNGAPFVAVNGHLREEFDLGGSVNLLAGWEWRSPTSNRRLRIGGQYYNGKEIQWSFFDESVQFIGGGIWFDF